MNRATDHFESGFTLLEMLISMAIGLVILAGLTSIFLANSQASRVLSSRTEQMGDLFLASHLMQAALRESVSVPPNSFPLDLQSGGRKPAGTCPSPNNKSVSLPANYPTSFPSYPYWDAKSKTITYQDQDGNTGIFQYQRSANDRIYWLRPDPCIYKFEELIRDLDPTNGLTVYNPTSATPKTPVTTSLGGGMEIKLQSQYTNESHQTSNLSLGLMIWPRN